MQMQLTNEALIFSSVLVVISILFSYSQNLQLEKDIIFSVSRAVIQLMIVGYFLDYIFGMESFIFTSLILLFMILNAARTSAKRVPEIKNVMPIAFISIAIGSITTLLILILTGAIVYSSSQVIPVSGMIISNSMVALGLVFRNLKNSFDDKSIEIETKLTLGADILPASINIIRESIKMGMIPTIDSAKTLGIVSLPGMMSGLILAGVSPVQAVKYQIMVTFMLIATTSIASFVAAFLTYKTFFNERKQLL